MSYGYGPYGGGLINIKRAAIRLGCFAEVEHLYHAASIASINESKACAIVGPLMQILIDKQLFVYKKLGTPEAAKLLAEAEEARLTPDTFATFKAGLTPDVAAYLEADDIRNAALDKSNILIDIADNAARVFYETVLAKKQAADAAAAARA